MKSKITKIAAGVTLLSVSAIAYAAGADCTCCLQACVDAICCCL